jgi:hypothetical protein
MLFYVDMCLNSRFYSDRFKNVRQTLQTLQRCLEKPNMCLV